MNSNSQPPKLPLKLLRFYCSEERLEELEGDLFEVFQDKIEEKGVRFSKIHYWWLVIVSFRSYALKKTKMDKRNWLRSALLFFNHNLIISKRNLLKNKTTTAINMLGLAIGLSAFIGIFRMVQYELSFNRQIPDKENIYRVYTSFSGAFSGTNRGVATGVHTYLSQKTTGLSSVSYFQTFDRKIELVDETGKENEIDIEGWTIIASEDYFDLINLYGWLYGDKDYSLNKPFQLVLTKKQAQKYYPGEVLADVIGKTVIYQDSLKLTVSGIVDRPETLDDFKFTNFISYPTIQSSWLKEQFSENDWSNTNSSSQLLIKTIANQNEGQLSEIMQGLNDFAEEQKEEGGTWETTFKTQPLSELHFDVALGTFDGTGGVANMKSLTTMGVVAFALLLIAIFNFINLETAQSAAKSKEVGLRKVMGGSKASLVGRFLTESTIVTLGSALLSIPIVYYGLNYLEEFVPVGFDLGLTTISFWVFLIVVVLVVGFIAGLYPAFVVSRYQPIHSLKSNNLFSKQGLGGSWIRKVLISFQFITSQLLIVCTLAVSWQIIFLLDKDLGFSSEGIIYFNTPYYEPADKLEVLLNEVKNMPEIEAVSKQQSPPASQGYSTSVVSYKTDSSEVISNVHRKSGDTSFLSLYNIKLLAGRNVNPIENGTEWVINESYMNELGFHNPQEVIGTMIEMNNKNYQVVGVVKDFNFQSLRFNVEPMMFFYGENNTGIAMKINRAHTRQVINKITDQWDKLYDQPLKVEFMDETLERFYNSETQLSRMASITTIVAILISCLGLFGLMSFIVVQKAKEMGIRKVLGASMVQIGAIISREFMVLLVVSFLISTPIAWYIINGWMENFAYQTPISIWIYLVGGCISLVAASISIGIKVWKSANSNPVDSLRYE